MRRICPLLLLSLLLAAILSMTALSDVLAAQGAERRVALVIGNGLYKESPLKNAVNDARDMASALRRLGFEVSLLTDAGLQQMDAAVREFGFKLRLGGAGLFYYAGHGLQLAGENYLVPVGASIQTESDVKYACLPAGMVLGRMEDARNDLNLVVLDACRNNPFARSFRSAEQGLAKMDAPTGTLISYATAPGSVASDGAGRNGLFTQHLLKNLAVPGLPVTEIFMRVRQGVVVESSRKQVPWEASSLIGQFYFSPPVEGVAPVQSTALSSPLPVTPRLDLKIEKKRLAEEAAQLKREKQELADLHALQAEKERLEFERQKVVQGKLLAMGGKPQQKPTPASAMSAASHAVQFAQLARTELPNVRAYFEQAVQAKPDDADARAGLAIALVFSGHEADAKYHLQRLNESAAQTPGVRLAKGLMFGLEGNADGLYQLSRAKEEGADQALVLLCQAMVAAKNGEFDKGQKLMAEHGALVPETERCDVARKLSRSLDPLGLLVGAFVWNASEDTWMSRINMKLTFSRNDGEMKGTGRGSFGGLSAKATATSFQIISGKVVIVLDVEVLLASKRVMRLTCDVLGGSDTIPVSSVDLLSRDGSSTSPPQFAGSFLVRDKAVHP